MFENPLLNSEPANAAATVTATRNSVLTWDRVRIQSGQIGEATGLVDELRIGTTYADVVPEPSTVALLSLGAMALGLGEGFAESSKPRHFCGDPN